MRIARWISRGSFLFLILYVGAPWRPLVRFLTPMTVHAQNRMPVNAALAPPTPLPQGACTNQAPAGQHGMTLCWTASISSTVIGYNVYSSTTAGGPYTKANAAVITGNSFFFPTGSLGGVKVFIVVRSTDGVAESVNSNEISDTGIGNPPPPTGLQDVKV